MESPPDADPRRIAVAELNETIDRVRRVRGEGLKSNYFFAPLGETDVAVWTGNRSLVFLDREHDFHRVYFFTRSLNELSALLRRIPQRPLVADYVTAGNDHDEIDEALGAAGFTKAAIYQRMINKNLSGRSATAAATPAREQEADWLYNRIREQFDVRLDRIPDRDRFMELVRQGQVLVHRRDSEVDGYVIYQLQGERAHLNYWYVWPQSHRVVALKLLSDFFAEMSRKRVGVSFLWVQTQKKSEIGIYRRLGYQEDGLQTHVYINERVGTSRPNSVWMQEHEQA